MSTVEHQNEISNLKATIHKLNDSIRQMTLEIERLKKFSVPDFIEGFNVQQQNNVSFRQLMKALQQAKLVIQKISEKTVEPAVVIPAVQPSEAAVPSEK